MYIGNLWLDYEEEGYKEHWMAKVDRAIIRDGEIVLDFSGQDTDYGSYEGSFKLKQIGDIYTGRGVFRIGVEQYSANVSASMIRDKKIVGLSGEWQEEGDTASYQLSVELEQVSFRR